MDLFSSKKTKCAGCGNNISSKEPKVDALKKHYHAACFACDRCHTVLGKDFIPVDDKPWCENCYAKHKAPKCAECGKGILEHRVKTDDGRSFHKECFENASQGVCAGCGDKIFLDQPVTEALGKSYHERCFRCGQCNAPLPAEFHVQGDIPVCDNCHKEQRRLERERQTEFSNEFRGEPAATVVRDANPDTREVTEYEESTRTVPADTTTVVRNADDVGGHVGKNVFGHPLYRETNVRDDVDGTNCSVCVEATGADREHVQYNGRHFHRNCFDNAHSGRCHGCNEKIRLSEPSVSVARLNRDWHVNCLNCARCNGNMSDQEFQLHEGAPVCGQCYRSELAPICAGCMQPIDGDKLKAMNSLWHPDCFNCTACNEPLYRGGRQFFNVEGRPYCERDVEAAQIPVA